MQDRETAVSVIATSLKMYCRTGTKKMKCTAVALVGTFRYSLNLIRLMVT